MSCVLSSNGIWPMRPFLRFPRTADSRPHITRPSRWRGWRQLALDTASAVPGHHALSFECAGLALGKQADKLVLFFDACRRKRNVIDYTGVQIATATEAAELLQRSSEFHALVESWIKVTHPRLI